MMGCWMGPLVAAAMVFTGATFTGTAACADPGSSGATISKETRREATRYYNQGHDAQERDDYEAARIAFEKSYELWPKPDALRALGASQIQSGRLLQGARNLSRFLAEAQGLSQEEVDALQDLVREAEAALGRVAPRANLDGASVFIDGEAVGVTPLRTPYHVTPGHHSVRVEKAGYAGAGASVEAPAGQIVELELKLHPVVQTPEPSPTPTRTTDRRPDVGAARDTPSGSLVNRTTVAVALGALAVGSAVFAYSSYRAGASAEDETRTLRRRLPVGSCTDTAPRSPGCNDLDAKVEDSSRAYTHSKIGLASAIGFGLGTLGVLVFWPSSSGGQAQLSVSSWFESNAKGLSVAGQF